MEQTHDVVVVGAGPTGVEMAGQIAELAHRTLQRSVAAVAASHDHDFLYINMGRDKGVNVGDTFAVVRPRGERCGSARLHR